MKEPGYVYIYLSNEETTPVDVFFDDFKVEHIKSPVIQIDDYYPFGLTFNSYQEQNGNTNHFLYNGKEVQDELGMGWMDYGARMYMPDIGRFFTQNRFAEKYYSLAPYQYTSGSPVNFNDVVSGLVTSKNEYGIHEVSNLSDSEYKGGTRKIYYSRISGQVTDEVKSRADFTLGHEIEHAWRHEKGLSNGSIRLLEEKAAVVFENYLRANSMSFQMRLTYSGEEIFSEEEKKRTPQEFGNLRLRRVFPATNGPGTDATRVVPNWSPFWLRDSRVEKIEN